jgi:tetratricopeptide (TPR) repeat protein
VECPGYAPVWFLKGRALAESGRDAQAAGSFIQALRIDPNHAPATYELLKLLHRRGRARMARMLARRAHDLNIRESLVEDVLQGRAAAPVRRSGATWRLPPTVPSACQGVILVVGSSYCGSTLLNVILGAHPKIGGGGELHWLIREPPAVRAQEGLCVFCGERCRVWTAQARADADAGNIYDLAASVLRKPFVCDSSKMPDWSAFIAPFTPVRRVRVLMVKHPIRQVASFVEKARRIDRQNGMTDIDKVLDQLAKLYDQVRRDPTDFVLRYEDLVADRRQALSPILASLGLAWDGAMDDWRTAPHHDIGGNAGPRSQIAPTRRPVGGFLQRKYNRGGVFLDDSFADVLTAAEIEGIAAHPLAKRICDEFGYDSQLAPGPDSRETALSAEEAAARLKHIPSALVGPFEPDGGHRFIARLELLPEHALLPQIGDTEECPQRSPLVLLENGRRLGPAHVEHVDIGKQGHGRYSHWSEVLYFSASDNSDPNRNGRRYEVRLRRWWEIPRRPAASPS